MLTPQERLAIGEARVIDALWEENTGSPDHRIQIIAMRARDAQSLATAKGCCNASQ